MADTNRGRISYIAQPTFGTLVEDPDMQILRFTNASLAYNKQTVQSDELSSDRMTADLIEVGASSGGDINFELSPTSYDAFIEAVLGGTRSTATASAAGDAAITFSTPTATVTDTGAFANVEVGQWLLFTGWSNSGNNGWKQVATNADANTITITDAGMTAEAAGGSGQIRGSTIKNGTTERQFMVEESYTDINVHRLFQDMRAGTLSLEFTAGQKLTGSIGFMGTEVFIESGTPSWLGTGSRTAAGTDAILNATSNVGGIYIDGALSTACFKSLSLNIDNAIRETQCIGSKFPSALGYGRQVVSGSFVKLFNSIVLYNAMLNHSDLSLEFGAYNSDGGIHIDLPRVKLANDGVGLSGGIDTDVDEPIDFTAIKDATGTYQIRVDIAG